MKKFQAEAQALAQQWDDCQTAIKNLEALRLSKLENLPVRGLEVRDEKIYIEGRRFRDLNTGAQFLKAIEIGSVGMGDLNLMISDRAEALDAEAFAFLEEAVVNSGITMLAARVAASGPLRSEPAGALVVA
jgi:hypothetical protein